MRGERAAFQSWPAPASAPAAASIMGCDADACYSRAETLLAKVIFLATGVWWGVGVQLMVYAGVAAEPETLLPNFTWYASMLLGLLLSERFIRVSCCDGSEEPAGCSVSLGCLRPRGRAAAAAAAAAGGGARRCAWWRLPPMRGLVSDRDLVAAALCDYFGTVATAMGLTLAGSGIFGIIYSSVSCWAALFSYCILGRRLVPLQLLGMAIVVAGLVVSSLENDFDSDDGRRVAFGSVAIAVGTVAYGMEYALCERLLSHGDGNGSAVAHASDGEADAAPPKPGAAPQKHSGNEAIVEMMYYMGLWGLGLSVAYTAVVVAPRWHYLVAEPASARRPRATRVFTDGDVGAALGRDAGLPDLPARLPHLLQLAPQPVLVHHLRPRGLRRDGPPPGPQGRPSLRRQ